MYTESRPAFDAKNRFGLPFVMPLDWRAFGDAIRMFYGLNGNGKPEKTENPVAPTATNGTPESELLSKVRQLMEKAKITEAEFIAVLQAAQIPEALSATSLFCIPDKSLVLAKENWASVIAMVDIIRAEKEPA